MDRFQNETLRENKLDKAMQEYDPDSRGLRYGRWSDLTMDILEEIFADKDNSWIPYWIYELDFGKKWKKGMCTDKNKKDIKLKTSSDLYDLLVMKHYEQYEPLFKNIKNEKQKIKSEVKSVVGVQSVGSSKGGSGKKKGTSRR